MKRQTNILLSIAMIIFTQEAVGSPGRSGGHQGGDSHGHHENSNFNPAPTWDAWDYDWSRPAPYNPPPVEPRPYIPGNVYRPLYQEGQPQPEIPLYPNTSLYVPTFTMATETPMVRVGETIKISVAVEKGAPPYTVFWRYNNDPDWIAGTTAFTRKAEQRGIITVTAIVKDLNEQVSQPQSTQIVVLGAQQ